MNARFVPSRPRAPLAGCGPGFALIDLLILLAVLAILAGLLLPAIARAKTKSQGVLCLSNHRQLMIAWLMYASDYQDELIRNQPGPGNRGPEPTARNWVSGWLDWSTSLDNQNTAFLTDPRWCPLAHYTGRSPGQFKCPGDVFISPVQRQAGGKSPRVRTVAMNACLGEGEDKQAAGGFPRLYRKLSDLTAPAQTWVLLDDHPDSIEDATFFVNLKESVWPDLPAAYHGGAGGFGFADGHGEVKKWGALASRAQGVAFRDYPGDLEVWRGADEDHTWLRDRTGEQ